MPTAPYSVIGDVLNLARVLVNDAVQALTGQTLTNAQPFTLVIVNSAWRKMQTYMLSIGYTGFARLKEEVTLSAIAAISSADWGSQMQLSWTSTPALPQDFISPLRLWERPSGYALGFLQMDQTLNGIPSAPKQSRNIVWDWRNDEINLPGTTVPFDLKIRYMAYLADFTALSVTTQPVPIMRCLNAFANFIAAEFSGGRGDLDAASFLAAGKEECDRMYSNDTAQAKSIQKPSEYQGMADVNTPGRAPAALPVQGQ